MGLVRHLSQRHSLAARVFSITVILGALVTSTAQLRASDAYLEELNPWLSVSLNGSLNGESSVDGVYAGLGSPEGGSLSGDMGEEITLSVRNTHETGKAAGMFLTNNGQIYNSEIQGTLQATAQNGLTYGIYVESTDSIYSSGWTGEYSMEFSGSIVLKNEGTQDGASYGYGKVSTFDGASVGLYNAETKGSGGFVVDWTKADFSVERVVGEATGAVFYQENITTDIAGDYSAVITGAGRATAILSSRSELGNITGRISATNTEGEAIGIFLGGSQVDTIISTITAKTQLGVARGLYPDGTAGVAFTGSIESESKVQAIGIQIDSVTDTIDVSGSVSINTLENAGVSYGYLDKHEASGMDSVALYNADTKDSQGFNVDWSKVDLSVSRDWGQTIGVKLGYESTVFVDQALGGSIKVETGQGASHNAIAIDSSGEATIRVEAGAKIEAVVLDDAGNKSHGFAIINSVNGINLTMEASSSDASLTQVEIYGNIGAGQDETLQFANGDFLLDSALIDAGRINVGTHIADGVFSTSTLTLFSTETVINTQQMYFTVNSLSDFSQIIVADGASLETTGLTSIRVFVGEGFALEEGQSLDLIVGDSDILSDPGLTWEIVGANGEQYALTSGGTGLMLARAEDVIPEPSTATLSLLALAALCARRRRAMQR